MGWFDSMAAGASAAGGGMGSLAGLGMGSGSPITVQPGQRLPGPFGGVDPSLLNGPQPVPGMPPQKMPLPGTDWGGNPVGPITGAPSPFPYQPMPGTDWGGHPIPTNPDGSPIFTGGGKDSTGMPLITDNWNPDNRGSGQPISQPMGPPIGYAEKPEDYQRRLASMGQGTGSLQSLGGGQLNQSGMVNLRGPDGSTKAVAQNDLAHWLSKGAVRV